MDNNNLPYEELIIRTLDGEASQAELNLLNDWLSASSENQEEYNRMHALFLMSGDLDIASQVDVEADLKLVKAKLPIEQKKTVIRKLLSSKFMMAASFFLVAAVTIVFYLSTTNNRNDSLLLADGTKVFLRDNATLDFSEEFNIAERRVKLRGEAYFEVHHDPSRPFIIDVFETEIKVLGTTFLVKEQNDQVDVFVESGKVEFSAKDKNKGQLVLTANEHGVYQDQILIKLISENVNYLAWHTGEFEFKATEIETVLRELSTFYPELKLGKSTLNDCPLTANFNNEKLETIIHTIEMSCSLKATKSRNAWIFE